MKYVLFIILSFISAGETIPGQVFKSNADTLVVAETTYFAETPAADASLNYRINERNINGFITSVKDKYPVQLGAFRIRYNAEAFLKEVRLHIDRHAVMFREEGLYKIRISGAPEPGVSYEGESTDNQIYDSDVENVTGIEADIINSPPNHPITAETGKYSTEAAEETIVTNNKEAGLNTDTNNEEARLNTVTDNEKAGLNTVTGNEQAAEKVAAGRESPGELIIGNNNPWLKRITYFGKSLALINTLIITIVICIVSMMLLLIFILLNRRRMEKKQKLHQYLMEKYQELIINYLFGNASPDDFRPIASDNYRRQVLIDQMIDVSINLKGDEAKKLLGLYKHLGLERDSIERARNHRWHKKIKGFRELAFMNIKDANDTIYKAINSSNEILRMEAQIALVRLGEDNPFDFLSHLERPFSLWEQISLHELIVQHEIPPPKFSQWLSSPNPTVVKFALRMIREFKQTEAEEAVHDTLMHPDPEVKQLAIQVAGDMNMRSTLHTMKHMYKFQSYNVCLEIIKSMGKMPDLSMLGFLKLVLDKEDDVQLQIEATKAIENNGEEGVKALVKIMKSEYKNYNIIVRHVLDRRIY